jgi:hypothetical protein
VREHLEEAVKRRLGISDRHPHGTGPAVCDTQGLGFGIRLRPLDCLRHFRHCCPLKHEAPRPVCRSGRFGVGAYLRSAAILSRYFLIMSSCSPRGTAWYLANSMVKLPLPWVAERRSVE